MFFRRIGDAVKILGSSFFEIQFWNPHSPCLDDQKYGTKVAKEFMLEVRTNGVILYCVFVQYY